MNGDDLLAFLLECGWVLLRKDESIAVLSKPLGADVQLDKANFDSLKYAVVDVPLSSHSATYQADYSKAMNVVELVEGPHFFHFLNERLSKENEVENMMPMAATVDARVQMEPKAATREKVDARKIRDELTKRSDNPAGHCYLYKDISGKLDLTGLHFPDPVIFKHCTFLDVVDASNARFESTLAFVDCKFRASMALRGAFIGGSLDVRLSKVSLPNLRDEFPNKEEHEAYIPDRQTYLYEAPPSWTSAKWDGLVVGGTIRAHKLEVEGNLNLGHINVAGSVYLKGAQIGFCPDKRKHWRLYLRQARIEGDLDLSPYTEAPTSEVSAGQQRFGLGVKQTMINGSLSIGSSVIKGRLNLRGVEIAGSLHAIMARVRGRFLADCWIDPDDNEGKSAYRTKIGVLKQSTSVDYDEESQRHISGYFQDTKFEAAVWMKGIVTEGALVFDNAQISGGLHFDVWFQPRKHPVEGLDWRIFDANEMNYGTEMIYSASIGCDRKGESIRLSNATVHANLDLKGVETKGRIVCHNTTVGGSFLCIPFQMLRRRLVIRPKIGMNCDGKSLSLYGAHVGGNVEISGSRFAGGIRMRYVTIAGVLWASKMLPMSKTKPEMPETLRPITEIGRTDDNHGLYLYGARINGNVCCDQIEVGGYVSFELAQITGSIQLKDSKVFWGFPLVKLTGEVEIESDNPGINNPPTEFGLVLKRARIANDVDLTSAIVVCGVDGTGSSIDGDFKSDKVRCICSEKRRYLISGGFRMERARIGGEWSMRSAIIDYGVNGRGVILGARLDLSLTSICSQHGNQECSGKGANNRRDGINFEDAKILGDVNLPQVNAGRDLNFEKAQINGTVRISKDLFESTLFANFDHSRIGSLNASVGAELAGLAERISMVGMKLERVHIVLEERDTTNDANRSIVIWRGCNFSRRNLAFFVLSVALLVGFLLMLLCLALGLDPLSLLAHPEESWISVRHELMFARGNALNASLFGWMGFYALCGVTCWTFYRRAFEIMKPCFTIGRRHSGDNIALLLSLMKGFSQGPYIVIRRILEQDGEKDAALQLYYRMREREIGNYDGGRWTLLFKWVFLVAAGSGVKVKPLCVFLALYFMFSWLAVFSNPDSIEHPSTFMVAQSEVEREFNARTGRGPGADWQTLESAGETWPFLADRGTAEQWSRADGFWMALKVHIPLLHLWAKEKWVPAAVAGWYYSPVGMRPMWFGIEYETYALFAQIVSYLTIPMLITAIRNSFYRGPETEAGEMDGEN